MSTLTRFSFPSSENNGHKDTLARRRLPTLSPANTMEVLLRHTSVKPVIHFICPSNVFVNVQRLFTGSQNITGSDSPVSAALSENSVAKRLHRSSLTPDHFKSCRRQCTDKVTPGQEETFMTTLFRGQSFTFRPQWFYGFQWRFSSIVRMLLKVLHGRKVAPS